MERTIKPDALQALMQTCKDVVVFDVRRPLSTSCLSRHSHVPVHHKRNYVLLGKGFKARFIEGGIEAWKSNGGQTVAK